MPTESAVESWIESEWNVATVIMPGDSPDDDCAGAADRDNRDSVSIKMASQMPSEAHLAYHGITTAGDVIVRGGIEVLLGISSFAMDAGCSLPESLWMRDIKGPNEGDIIG